MEMNLSRPDAKMLWSLIWDKEQILDKKRRWLMGSPMTSTSESNQKKSKKPKFLTNVSLPESYTRSDEVTFDTVRINVERSFRPSTDAQECHHVVLDYMQLFGSDVMKSYSANPSNFLKIFSSAINDLNSNALCIVARIVTRNDASFVKSRPSMKKIIKDYLPKVFAESNCEDSTALVQQLSQVFRKPSNFESKQLTLATPITPHLLSSIRKTLEGLDKLPCWDLIAVNRKLRGIMSVPQFPPVLLPSYKRELLIKRVRKRFKKILSTVREGVDLPKPLSRALSVVRLSLKMDTRCVDILASEFFPHSPKVMGLQNDILRALWSLKKVKHDELNALHRLVDPEDNVPKKGFRMALRKYLMGCLFECDEIDIPKKALRILAFLNRRSRRRPVMYSKEVSDGDVETVLNISTQLKQHVQNSIPDCRVDEETSSAYLEGIGSDDGSESNDFELQGGDYCCNPGGHENEKIYDEPCTNEEAEATGDSVPLYFTRAAGAMITKEPKLEQNDLPPCLEGPTQQHHQICHNNSQSMREATIKEICDETSLVSYRLVGQMLEKYLQLEGRDIDAMTRFYLRGGSSHPVDPQVIDEPLHTSIKDARSRVLIQAVEELLPTFPKSCVERIKKLIGDDSGRDLSDNGKEMNREGEAFKIAWP